MEKINIITLGTGGVGKSSLIHRYTKGIFKIHTPTFIDKYAKQTDVNGQNITVMLWDTSGQETFRSITRSYYRPADGVLLVYSVDDLESCEMLQSWLSDFRCFNDSAKVIVVGNKSEDSIERSQKGIEIVRQLLAKENLEHTEVSAKTGKNVQETMQYLIERILVTKGILNVYNRPECITSNFPEETGSNGQGTNNLSRNQQNLEDQNVHLDAKTPKKRKGCC